MHSGEPTETTRRRPWTLVALFAALGLASLAALHHQARTLATANHQEIEALERRMKADQEHQTAAFEELKKSLASQRQRDRVAAPLPSAQSEWDNWSIIDPRVEEPHQVPDRPEPKLGKNGLPTPPFITTHLWFKMELARVQPDLVFFGDSITEAWKKAPEIWNSSFGAYRPMNLGLKATGFSMFSGGS